MPITSFADLLDVQEIDTHIDRLLDQRRNLPELNRFKENHEGLAALGGELAEARDELKQLELSLDKTEGELEMLETKLGEHETRLFAGGMSGRETEHMRLEVQSLRGQKDTIEERVLAMLENIDPARETVQGLEERVGTLDEERSTLETSIKEQWKKIDAELARYEERKREAIVPIAPDLLELYDKLREIKEGVAVAPYDHGVCGGCHMALSPSEQVEAFAGEVPRCVHFRRILVA